MAVCLYQRRHEENVSRDQQRKRVREPGPAYARGDLAEDRRRIARSRRGGIGRAHIRGVRVRDVLNFGCHGGRGLGAHPYRLEADGAAERVVRSAETGLLEIGIQGYVAGQDVLESILEGTGRRVISPV